MIVNLLDKTIFVVLHFYYIKPVSHANRQEFKKIEPNLYFVKCQKPNVCMKNIFPWPVLFK